VAATIATAPPRTHLRLPFLATIALSLRLFRFIAILLFLVFVFYLPLHDFLQNRRASSPRLAGGSGDDDRHWLGDRQLLCGWFHGCEGDASGTVAHDDR
jgi:hypothetical protein